MSSKEQNAALTQTVCHIDIRLLKPAFLMQATFRQSHLKDTDVYG